MAKKPDVIKEPKNTEVLPPEPTTTEVPTTPEVLSSVEEKVEVRRVWITYHQNGIKVQEVRNVQFKSEVALVDGKELKKASEDNLQECWWDL